MGLGADDGSAPHHTRAVPEQCRLHQGLPQGPTLSNTAGRAAGGCSNSRCCFNNICNICTAAVCCCAGAKVICRDTGGLHTFHT